jgi:hypothetical protein
MDESDRAETSYEDFISLFNIEEDDYQNVINYYLEYAQLAQNREVVEFEEQSEEFCAPYAETIEDRYEPCKLMEPAENSLFTGYYREDCEDKTQCIMKGVSAEGAWESMGVGVDIVQTYYELTDESSDLDISGTNLICPDGLFISHLVTPSTHNLYDVWGITVNGPEIYYAAECR